MLEDLFNYAKDKEYICTSPRKFIQWLAYMSDASRAKPILRCIEKLGIQNPYILDLGCGFGTITKELLKIYKNVFALEIKPERVDLSKKITPNLKLYRGDCSNIPFKNEFFDVIILNDVLEYNPLDKHTTIFKEVYRTLKENGRFFLRSHNKLEIFYLFKKSKSFDKFRRTSFSLGLILKKSGFTLPTNIFFFTFKNLFRRAFCLSLAKDK